MDESNNSTSSNIKGVFVGKEPEKQDDFKEQRPKTEDHVYIDKENRITISSSKLDHMESLLKKASDLEIIYSKWSWLEKVYSSCFSISSGIIVFLITDYCDDGFVLPNSWVIFMKTILGFGVLSGIALWLIERQIKKDHKKTFSSFIDEVLQKIKKMKNTFNEDS